MHEPPPRGHTGSDRGQTYTLEGVLGALLLLGALLSAQSLVVTPTTGGSVDEAARADVRTQVRDALAVSREDGSLSRTVRYWNDSTVERTFAGADRPAVGYGDRPLPTGLGPRLETVLSQRGYRYNVIVAYQTASEPTSWERLRLRFQGPPSNDAVVVSVPTTVYDDDRLTGPAPGDRTFAAAHRAGVHPIPDVHPAGPLYNVVEVRVVAW